MGCEIPRAVRRRHSGFADDLATGRPGDLIQVGKSPESASRLPLHGGSRKPGFGFRQSHPARAPAGGAPPRAKPDFRSSAPAGRRGAREDRVKGRIGHLEAAVGDAHADVRLGVAVEVAAARGDEPEFRGEAE